MAMARVKPSMIKRNRNAVLMNSNGVTLIEMMVAMMLLVVFLAPALSGFMLAESETQRSMDSVEATAIASRTIEDIKDLASIHFFDDRLGGNIRSDTPYNIDLTDFPSQQKPDPRFTVQATVKVWAFPPGGAEMQDVKEVTVKVFRVGQTTGAPLSEISQWITLGGP